MRYVHAPLSSKGLKRLFVVISDALRYEAARDFADRLNGQAGKGWLAEGATPNWAWRPFCPERN
jgi:hypothetical protein